MKVMYDSIIIMCDILRIDQQDLNNPALVKLIHTHPESHLYWTDDWSPEFYSRLAYEGLISTSYTHDDYTVLIPEMQRSYAVLDWDNLHYSRQVKKLLNRIDSGEYIFSVQNNVSNVIQGIQSYHKPCWLTVEYESIMHSLSQTMVNPSCLVFSVELKSREGLLVAGEIGYKTGSIYTSLSGFIDRKNGPAGCGNLQMVLLAEYLQNHRFLFWNLGHPEMEYKEALGARILERDQFLQRWKLGRDSDQALSF